MAETIRWGILGTGGIANNFVGDLLANGFTVTAVGSRSQASADAFASRHGIGAAHPSYQALADDPEVDVVYVATPHPFHVENALTSIRAGKHVLVEKPLTLNAAEAKQIADAASEAGVVALEAMWTRFLPHMVRIREIIAAGTLGDVRTVIADHNQKLPSDPSHRLNNPDLGGGALLDLGIYPVSFAVDVLGVPSRVQATATMTETGVDRQTGMLFEHEGGRQSILSTALDTNGPTRAVVVGTEARIEIDSTWYAPSSFRVIAPDESVLEHYEGAAGSGGMQFEAWEIERVISSGESVSPRMPIDQSVAIMGVLDEVRRQIGLVYPGERR